MVWYGMEGKKRGNREKKRLSYRRNVRENKQEGEQRSKSKEVKLVWKKMHILNPFHSSGLTVTSPNAA